MQVHSCPGLRTRPLATYLAALGLAKVIGEQADPGVRFGWSGGTFSIRTTVNDLVDFLVTDYRPTPVISPWNGGSGFGDKDKGQVGFVKLIAESEAPRLSDYRATIVAARRVLASPGADNWSKERLIQELRNWLPDSALTWLDAAVVLTADKPVFPPLIGTGGNDGRLDYSSNFHQRLSNVLPQLGAKVPITRKWADNLLQGQGTTPLVGAAVGQFDPIGAGGPGSSVHGAADSLINPWLFVLMIEGLTWFASAPARRLGGSRGMAAMPFTVRSSPDGPLPGAAAEEARGELWAPVFESVSLPNLAQIMGEARTAWDGRTAESVPAMYGAVHTFGVDRGITAFERYGFLQRNGLAFVAAPLDRVVVREAPEVAIALNPLRRVDTFSAASGSATEQATRRFDAAVTDYLREPSPQRLVTLLERQTRLEITAMRAEGNHGHLAPPGPLAPAATALEILAPLLASSAEARLAAGVASAYLRVEEKRTRSLRHLLVGSDPGQPAARPVASGVARRPAAEVLADLLVWRAQHPVPEPRLDRGWLPFTGHSYRTHWSDIHAWATGQLNAELITRHLLAFLALDWGPVAGIVAPRPPITTINPDLAVLQAFAGAQVVAVGVPPSADDGRIGLQHDWAVRLRAGQTQQVCREASALLARSLVRGGSPQAPTLQRYVRLSPKASATSATDPRQSIRLLAALAAPASTGALKRIVAPFGSTQPLLDDTHHQGVLQ